MCIQVVTEFVVRRGSACLLCYNLLVLVPWFYKSGLTIRSIHAMCPCKTSLAPLLQFLGDNCNCTFGQMSFNAKTRKNFDAVVILACLSFRKNRNSSVFNNADQQHGGGFSELKKLHIANRPSNLAATDDA